jgi:hypothetical protein
VVLTVTEPVADVPVMLTLTPVSVELAVRFPPVGVPVHSSLLGAVEVQGAMAVLATPMAMVVSDRAETGITPQIESPGKLRGAACVQGPDRE